VITTLLGYDLLHPECNVTPNIASRVGINLHKQERHPLHTIKQIIQEYWNEQSHVHFTIIDDLSPIVAAQENFDSLLIPPDHTSRSKSDTYYLTKDTVLRTHTSAHQAALLGSGLHQFLVTGDVYRRDEIDSSHYPVFHQMEGVKMFTDKELPTDPVEQIKALEADLKGGLEGMTKALFGDVEMRWVDTYFPFTEPSFELEIYFRNEWLEVLGCGIIQQEIVDNAGRGEKGWAFGLGLERLAMVLFSIPDIRLFWSSDARFHDQFQCGRIITFQPYSKYPACCKDISFWTTESFHPNDLNELVRDVVGDLAERVELIDSFTHPKTQRVSNCFRIYYRSMDRSLTNMEIDSLQERVRENVALKLGVEIR
jgi:phenylalanyl-tRNA synthetase alpha chain